LAEKAASLKAGLAIPQIVFARLDLYDGRYDEAIEHARRAVEEEPGNVDAYFTQALVLTAAGRHDEARAAINEVFRRDPKPAATAYALLGAIQFSLRDYVNAITNLETYSKAIPEGGTWLYPGFLFAAYGEVGRRDKASAGIEPGRWSIMDWDLASTRFQVFYRHPEDTEHLLEGLRKAGAPERPYGIDWNTADKVLLSDAALRTLFFGHSFNASCSGINTAWRVSADGSVNWTAREIIQDSGHGRIDAGKLCLRLSFLTHNKEACSTVYRNTGVTSFDWGRGYDFVLIGPSVCFFSQQK